MAVAWTTIPNGDVDVDSPVTTALVTALRDNPEGIAQRASGAPKIFGVAYRFQEFTTSGTWTKPSNAETGDHVYVLVVGGGGAGDNSNRDGGSGGGGIRRFFDNISNLASSETVTVGASAAAGSQAGGGTSSFGTSGNRVFTQAVGGKNGSPKVGSNVCGGQVRIQYNGRGTMGGTGIYDSDNDGVPDVLGDPSCRGGHAGAGVSNIQLNAGGASVWGGGGGGGSLKGGNGGPPGASGYAGSGGRGGDNGAVGIDGRFPGGGGGAGETGNGGGGAAGVVRVWCVREN